MTLKHNGLSAYWQNIKNLPTNLYHSIVHHGIPTSDRDRSQTMFNNFFLHIHPARVHPRSLTPSATWGLGILLISQFIILTVSGILLMIYYIPSTEMAYNSIKDLHYVVSTGRFIRNIHRWAAHLMVITIFLHMGRVFYTNAYKSPRELNWLLGMILFIITLVLSFTGYLLPWDQLAFWAVTIGVNIAESIDELSYALGLPDSLFFGQTIKQLLLGSSRLGQDALIRFYVLHVMILPIIFLIIASVHIWRIRKDGGLANPEGNTTLAGKGVETLNPEPSISEDVSNKTIGLMAIVRGRSNLTGQKIDLTVPSWPYLLRAELLVFMICMLLSVVLGFFWDAPLKEMANPSMPENPSKAPWYFLGLQEMVSYSAFSGGILIPTIVFFGLTLIPFLDREETYSVDWFSGKRGKLITLLSSFFALITSILTVSFYVNFGWLRDWFPEIPQLIIILINPGTILTLTYALWSGIIMQKTNSTRMGAIALFTCFIIGYIVFTIVGFYFRGPNWEFYWSKSMWPVH